MLQFQILENIIKGGRRSINLVNAGSVENAKGGRGGSADEEGGDAKGFDWHEARVADPASPVREYAPP